MFFGYIPSNRITNSYCSSIPSWGTCILVSVYVNWMLWFMPVIPTLERKRPEDQKRFKVILSYTVTSRQFWSLSPRYCYTSVYPYQQCTEYHILTIYLIFGNIPNRYAMIFFALPLWLVMLSSSYTCWLCLFFKTASIGFCSFWVHSHR